MWDYEKTKMSIMRTKGLLYMCFSTTLEAGLAIHLPSGYAAPSSIEVCCFNRRLNSSTTGTGIVRQSDDDAALGRAIRTPETMLDTPHYFPRSSPCT
jgi:hypothetical protein